MRTNNKGLIRRIMAVLLSAFIFITYMPGLAYAIEVMPAEQPSDSKALQKAGKIKAVSGGTAEDADALLQGYLDKRLKEQLGTAPASNGMRKAASAKRYNTLNQNEKAIYGEIKTFAYDVASGNESIAYVTFDVANVFSSYFVEIYGYNAVTSSSLGIDSPVYVKDYDEYGDPSWDFSDEAKEKLFDFDKIFDALMADEPYAFYWLDKTVGIYYELNILLNSEEDSSDIYFYGDPSMSVISAVSVDYRADSADYLSVDTERTGATSRTIDSAAAIIAENSSLPDLEKLNAYKDRICELTSYNKEAAADIYYPYGDPWQMINVFDGLPVVCEGYAKAFQYLCDNTTFKAGIECDTVTGKMQGLSSEDHMWNILHMDDGKNYIADITNSDDGAVGEHGGLFISPAMEGGSVSAGYEYDVNNDRKADLSYSYDNNILSLFSDEELTMSETAYGGSEDPGMDLQNCRIEPVDLSSEVIVNEDWRLVIDEECASIPIPQFRVRTDNDMLLPDEAFTFTIKRIESRDDQFMPVYSDEEVTVLTHGDTTANEYEVSAEVNEAWKDSYRGDVEPYVFSLYGTKCIEAYHTEMVYATGDDAGEPAEWIMDDIKSTPYEDWFWVTSTDRPLKPHQFLGEGRPGPDEKYYTARYSEVSFNKEANEWQLIDEEAWSTSFPEKAGVYICILESNAPYYGTVSWIDLIRVEEEIHTHSLKPTAAKDASCTEPGNIAYWYCSGCSKYFSDAEGKTEIAENSWVTSALGHDYQFSKMEWSKANDGYTAKALYVCSHDAGHTESYDADVTSATTPAICDKDGQVVYTSSYDGHTETKTDTIVKLGHAFGPWESDGDSQHKRVCANDPTHVETGAHEWDAGTESWPDNDAEPGVRTYTCTVCNEIKTEPLKSKLETAKEAALEELAKVNVNDYSGAEKTAVENAVAEARQKINDAQSIQDVNTAKTGALNAINAQKTDAQKAAEAATVVPAAPPAPVEFIDLPTVKISKPAAAKKKITVKWKKVSKKNLKKISGIQIQVATDPGFTNIVKTATAGKKKTSKAIKGLKPKTKYYVRIRAYAAGNHYSVWKSKSAKVK